ncbi:unnamed protein product [Pseudo-nitzschia multistriata]|uniref:Uncharacterized protein n=1 Tax=Pseudo-nitzschia multistriata TaxID=183589 RepID=A0A448Z9P3_9STRA|nr:unnamed protein product [Pseudo-nitzschia multistriata]
MPKGKVAKTSSSSAKRKKPSREKTSGGNAAQTVLNVVGTIANQSGSNATPRDKVVAYAKIEGVIGTSTFANALTKLRKQELIILSPKVITITEKGMDQADTTEISGGTNEDYQKKRIEQLNLRPKSIQLLQELSDGKVHNKKKVAAAIGCKMNSTWANMLTSVKKLQLVKFDRETITLSDDMFPFGRPE